MAIKQYVSLNEPLCGIGTYKDILNLDTGATTRQIKKLVLDGTETFTYDPEWGSRFVFTFTDMKVFGLRLTPFVSTHYQSIDDGRMWQDIPDKSIYSGSNDGTYKFFIKDTTFSSVSNFANYLASEYAAGTPVTIWYILASPTTSTTTLPHGLSGTVEGSLTQTGTPTPTNPIYPTANSIDAFLDKKYLKYGTETDTITNLPKEIIADGQSASANIIGNMNQQGTPSPSNIIMPDECGNKTANLFDISQITSNSGITNNGDGTLTISGYPVNADQTLKEMCPDLKVGDTVYLKFITTGLGAVYIRYYESSALKWSDTWGVTTSRTMTDEYLNARVGFYRQSSAQGGGNAVISNLMICAELSATYQPFGYKIPILSGGTTTPVYLGQVQSTRKIKKLVFDGTENWRKSANGAMYLSPFTGDFYKREVAITSMNSHFAAQINTTSGTNEVRDNSSCFFAASGSAEYYIGARSYATAADFKTYLQQQYSAGTPVTVWYVLATPTTGIVNEPLRKIGNYADSVSVTGIPTTGTAEQFDISTTLKPSEVDLTYHGWHSQEPNKYEETGQLYDKTTDVNGYRLNPSGNLIAENGYSTSLAIPVNTKFLTRNHEFSTMEPICEYKANNTFIARTVSGSTIELNDETSYVRMTVNNTWDDVTLKGSQWT